MRREKTPLEIAEIELHHARGVISASRHIISVEETRIASYLRTVRLLRIEIRRLEVNQA